MCLNLHKAGARMIVYNRSRAVIDQVDRPGIVAADSPADVARSASIVLLMVSDTPAVEQVLFGEYGILSGLNADSLIIDMGTTSVVATRKYARRIQDAGAAYVDAPVSGGEIGAIDASLAIMAGGDNEAIARARAVFDILGSRFTHVGGIGAGQVAKAANQIIVGLNIGAVAEALALAQSAGADPARVREALMGGFAASRILEVHGQRMIDGDFMPGAKVSTQYKDLVQALELGGRYEQELPATELNLSLYQSLIENGQGDLDHSALIKVLKPEAI